MNYEKFNREIRDKLMAKKGVSYQCEAATQKLIAASGSQLEHWAGFFQWETHHWAVDPQTGVIYDPTMEQFGVPWQGGVKPQDPLHAMYRGTPYQEVAYWAYSQSGKTSPLALERYLRFKESVGEPSVMRGEKKVEEKVAKNGSKYLLLQDEVYFACNKMEAQFRSATVWRAKRGGHNAYVLTQRCVETKTGKFIFPVKRQAYYIPPELNALIPLTRGKWGKVIRPAPWKPLAIMVQFAKSWA